MTKEEAFQTLKDRNPRGADAGARVFYIDERRGQRVDFVVAAEQVWQTTDVSRVMGLVWLGSCTACGEGFFQLSCTHPTELRETCEFCSSARYETFNSRDWNVFNPGSRRASIPLKRRGRWELHILEFLDAATAQEGAPVSMSPEEVIDGAAQLIPAPEDGKRDIRRQSLVRAFQALARETDGPLRMADGAVLLPRKIAT